MSIGFPHKTEISFSSLQGTDPRYPALLRAFLGPDAPAAVTALGDLALLDSRPLAIFCSVALPGQPHRAGLRSGPRAARSRRGGHRRLPHAGRGARAWRSCWPAPGRSSSVRRVGCTRPSPPSSASRWRPAGCSCSRRSRRPSGASRQSWRPYRNRFVAALAHRVLFVHAAPGGRTEALAQEVIGWGKPVYTLGHAANSNVSALGAAPLQANEAGWPRTSGSCPIPDEVE